MDRNQSSTLKLIRQHCFPNPLYSSVITLSHNPPFFSSQHLFKTQGMTVSQRRALEGGKGERCSGWWDWRVTDPLEDEALMSHRDPVSSTHWSRWMMTGFVKGLCVCVCVWWFVVDLLFVCTYVGHKPKNPFSGYVITSLHEFISVCISLFYSLRSSLNGLITVKAWYRGPISMRINAWERDVCNLRLYTPQVSFLLSSGLN